MKGDEKGVRQRERIDEVGVERKRRERRSVKGNEDRNKRRKNGVKRGRKGGERE